MEADRAVAVISIIGMHRSGTSALAGAIHKLGADLGSKSSWVQPAADNPRGFFEYAPVVDLNTDLLIALGGTWSTPPPLPHGWVTDPALDGLRDRAERLISEMPDRMVVKDPRLSLVQPLWESVQPVRASLLCLRHPTAVADSLTVRNGFTTDEGLFLWFRYNAAAIVNRPDALVVEYETLLTDPIPSLRSVAEHVDLEASDQTVEIAAASVYGEMSHHAGGELPETPIGILCRRLHTLLESGLGLESDSELSLFARLITELPWAGPSDRDISRARHETDEYRTDLGRLRTANVQLDRRLRRLQTELRHSLQVVDNATISESLALLLDREGRAR